MQSDSGILYHEPPKPLWVPQRYSTRPQNLSVRFKTWICDGDGKIIRPGQEGWNTITDFGMDSLATAGVETLINYLHLSSALGTAKRTLPGGTTLSLTSVADPTNVPVTASAAFFLAGDVGNTLYIDGLGQELKITAFTDSQHVTCATRPGVWLPGLTPTTGPFSTAGVHFTSANTLTTDFYAANTYDTGALNYNAELNDSANSRFIHQRIYLTAAAPSSWTINQLGWSANGTVGGSVFGKVNLTSPDNVAIGQKYRVQLQLFSGYTPINIASQSVNWGATIGTYDLAIRQEVIPKDSNTTQGPSFLKLKTTSSPSGWAYATAAFSLVSTLWEGDAGYSNTPHASLAVSITDSACIINGAYTSGSHNFLRTFKLNDTSSISLATGIVLRMGSGLGQILTLKPNTGTITKPSGYYASLIFPLYWTRGFTN
jgi:hypothetical protein